MGKCSFITGTAAMVIFDPSALKHRLDAKADWWSVPSAELAEVNLGNAIFVALGSDGRYEVDYELIDDPGAVSDPQNDVSANLRCISGVLFIGPGEMVTNDGLEPDTTSGGTFLKVRPRSYKVTIGGNGSGLLKVSLSKSQDGTNSFDVPLALTR